MDLFNISEKTKKLNYKDKYSILKRNENLVKQKNIFKIKKYDNFAFLCKTLKT